MIAGGAVLQDAYARPLEFARRLTDTGRPVVLATSHAVPVELIRAAGCVAAVLPRRVRPPSTDAARYLEAEGLGAHASALVSAAFSGDFAFASAMVVGCASEQEYKAFLYLRELSRQGAVRGLPPVWAYESVHSHEPHAEAYNKAQVHSLWRRLATLTAQPTTEEALATAIAEYNDVRRALRRVMALRCRPSMICGADAVAMIAARGLLEPPHYARTLLEVVAERALGPVVEGSRLLIGGAWPGGTGLVAWLEVHAAVVVAEDTDEGAGAATEGISVEGDVVANLVAAYVDRTPSLRQPVAARDRWFERAARADVQGVVFSLPADDAVVGWDYPRQRDLLGRLGIPSLVIRGDVEDPAITSRSEPALRAFLAEIEEAA